MSGLLYKNTIKYIKSIYKNEIKNYNIHFCASKLSIPDNSTHYEKIKNIFGYWYIIQKNLDINKIFYFEIYFMNNDSIPYDYETFINKFDDEEYKKTFNDILLNVNKHNNDYRIKKIVDDYAFNIINNNYRSYDLDDNITEEYNRYKYKINFFEHSDSEYDSDSEINYNFHHNNDENYNNIYDLLN
jgi:hypothetical protein